MTAITDYLAAVPLFLAYFGTGLGLIGVYTLIYTWLTPHDEMGLIKENKPAASVAFVGSLTGFILPLASVVEHAINLMDMVLWGFVALLVQSLTFFAVRIAMPKISERIANDEMAAGILLGGVSIAAGLLNAACLTY